MSTKDTRVVISIYHVPVLELAVSSTSLKKYGGEIKLNDFILPMVQRVVNHVVANNYGYRILLSLQQCKLHDLDNTNTSEISYRLEYDYGVKCGDDNIYFKDRELFDIRNHLMVDSQAIQNNVDMVLSNN